MAECQPSDEEEKQKTIDRHWMQTLDGIKSLVKEQESGQHSFSGIIKKQMQNGHICQKCQKSFGFFNQPRKCSKCDAEFCKNCVLEVGRLQVVCLTCLDNNEPQSLEQTRDLKHCFQHMRQLPPSSSVSLPGEIHRTPIRIYNFRDNLDFEKECIRLENGFKASLQRSMLGKMFQDILGDQISDWKKSSLWVYGNMISKCYSCQCDFGLMHIRHNCVLCGSVVCTDCSTKDLLVYIPDGQNLQNTNTRAYLAIIKIIGCPDKEPDVCMYLRVCPKCNEKVQDRQIAALKLAKKELVKEDDVANEMLLKMIVVNDKLCDLRSKIDCCLQKYFDLLKMLDVSAQAGNQKLSYKSNMQVLAKAQGDLSDHFSEFVTVILKIKTMKPSLKSLTTLFQNIVASKIDYYHTNTFRFRQMQKQLESVVPRDILSAVQDIVDRNAINSCYISIKQLAMEVLHLCNKHSLNIEILPKLMQITDIAEVDLKSSLKDPWPEQEAIVSELLKQRLKQNRLIQPSKRLLSQLGTNYLQTVIQDRSGTLLNQIYLQLSSKSSDSKYQPTKLALKNLTSDISPN